MEPFCYRAHQHLPLTDDDYYDHDDNVDKFFDTNIPIDEIQIKQEVFTPRRLSMSSPPLLDDINNILIKQEQQQQQYHSDDGDDKHNESFKSKAHRRRSLSVHSAMQSVTVQADDIDQLTVSLKTVFITKEGQDNSSSYMIKGNTINNNTTPPNNHKNNLYYNKSSSQNSLPAYVSLAEAIYHMQKDTPERFHTTSRKLERKALEAAINRRKAHKQEVTIPQSPALLSKTRNRKTMVLSQKDLEEMEVNEMKKHQIRANPIPKTVLLGGLHLPPVLKRPTTHPEPFKLSQIKKKPVPMPAYEIKAFNARPLPKHIFDKPFELNKNTKPVTRPMTPKFQPLHGKKPAPGSLRNVPRSSSVPSLSKCPLKKAARDFESFVPTQNNVGHTGVPIVQKVALHPCKPKPFSFEQRDKERLMKKEMEIKRYLDNEKKLREFHANPIPTVIRKKSVYSAKKDNPRENKENVSKNNGPTFKARTPLVLSKAPFVPVKSERPVLTPCSLQLATEVRAKERDDFDQKIKKDKELMESLLKQNEVERKRTEEKEIAELRKNLVHKAQPVRNYAVMKIEHSNLPLTMPATPKFSYKK